MFVGCPASNANVTAGLDEGAAVLPLLAWVGVMAQLPLPSVGTSPWCFSFEKVNLANT